MEEEEQLPLQGFSLLRACTSPLGYFRTAQEL
jgi:hypothetical protein